jgi:hypothetical protein
LTLDDDVAVRLEKMRQDEGTTFKEIVNRTLRRGLDSVPSPKKDKPFRTRTFSAQPLRTNFDNIAELLAFAEGEDYR